MKIQLWGTRGSIPAPGACTQGCGGDTSCVEVLLNDGTRLILDAGSGIRNLGNSRGPCEAVLLLSHYHWDHIQGMPFFGPIYSPDSAVEVLGPAFEGRGPFELLGGQVAQPYFPAPPSQWQGIKSFAVTPSEPFTVGRAVVRTGWLSHPGPTLGYRIEDGDAVLVYISDNEVDCASPEMLSSIVHLAAGADLLIHDCQYFEDEYASRRGWGHSTPRQAVRVAREAGVGRLMLFHHDPAHTDEQVEALACEARDLAGDREIAVAREGDVIVLEGRGTGGSIAMMDSSEGATGDQ